MKHFFLLSIGLLLIGCNQPPAQVSTAEVQPKPKRIIFLIGDGMGLSQVSTMQFYAAGGNQFERFPVVGLSKTSSAFHKITDSAAGATAFSTGKKTYNGAIGVGPDTVSLPLLPELLKPLGYLNGLVATSSITHATPASFYARAKWRDMEELIASQLAKAPIHFFAGGGKDYFLRRTDGLNQLNNLEQAGVVVDTTAFTERDWKSVARMGYLLAADGMPRALDGREGFLPKATDMALRYLTSKGERSFLMVEGSQIDWAGHDNEGDYLVAEMKDFNEVLRIVLDYAEADGNTLVVVTADHECGGFTLAGKETDGKADYDAIDFRFSTTGHSAAMVPVFAFGPGANEFSGVYENTEIFHKMLQLATP